MKHDIDMTDYSKNIYCETWETEDGYKIDIAFNWYEMKMMPYEYRYEKRKGIFENRGLIIETLVR